MDPQQALLTVTAAHAGFQVVVSTVVYPALADVPSDGWALAHERHSRRISYVVVPLYALIVGTSLWAVIDGPVTAAVVVTVLGNALALVTTAVVAAPTHGRLGSDGRTAPLVGRLLWSDRIRTFGAIVALMGACLI